MNEVATLAAITLAAILAWAAVTKLARPIETARDFRNLGLPAPLFLARAVPAAEVAVAIGLAVAPGWGGVAAFVLLSGFTAWLYSLVRAGVLVSCGCFGSASAQPVSMTEIVRNLGLLGLAGAAASITSLASPNLPAIILFTTALLIGAVIVHVVALAQLTNGLFRAELAGELTAPDGTSA